MFFNNVSVASLLSCLHQLRAENQRLEEHVNSLLQRRDHLLAVNARLAIPLIPTTPGILCVHVCKRGSEREIFSHLKVV